MATFDVKLSLRSIEHRPRVLIMVSKYDHCLVDLLYQWRTGELAVDLPVIATLPDHPAAAAVLSGAAFPTKRLTNGPLARGLESAVAAIHSTIAVRRRELFEGVPS